MALIDISKNDANIIVLTEHVVRQAMADTHAEYPRIRSGHRPCISDSTHVAARDRMVGRIRRGD